MSTSDEINIITIFEKILYFDINHDDSTILCLSREGIFSINLIKGEKITILEDRFSKIEFQPNQTGSYI